MKVLIEEHDPVSDRVLQATSTISLILPAT